MRGCRMSAFSDPEADGEWDGSGTVLRPVFWFVRAGFCFHSDSTAAEPSGWKLNPLLGACWGRVDV
jgi:hypothetical protein